MKRLLGAVVYLQLAIYDVRYHFGLFFLVFGAWVIGARSVHMESKP